MKQILTASEAKETDRIAMQELGISGNMLMHKAGCSVGREALAICRQKMLSSVQIFCGKGNNGGDGYVAAIYLAENGFREIDVFCFADPNQLSGESAYFYSEMFKKGIAPVIIHSEKQLKEMLKEDSLWVDAIFGTGINRPVKGLAADILKLLAENQKNHPVLAVDIPSGLDGGSGLCRSEVLHADITVTMGFYKTGLFLNRGQDYCGRLVLTDLPYPRECFYHCRPRFLFSMDDLRSIVKPLIPSGHKYEQGHVIVAAGSEDMPGAAAMSSAAAGRSGAGMVRLLTARSASAVSRINFPGLLVRHGGKNHLKAKDLKFVRDILKKCGAACIGPGLGRHRSTGRFVRKFIEISPVPVVADADALFAMDTEIIRKNGDKLILTPHLGEFSRLADMNMSDLKEKLANAAGDFSIKNACVCHLKSSVSITALPDGSQFFHADGVPGMATAGSGDVLSGIATAFSSQGYSPGDAMKAAAGCHQLAGKMASVKLGNRGMTAMDILDHVSYALKEIEVTV